MELFLAAFMTETERTVLAKRLSVGYLLNKGASYDQIKNELRVSSATISTVADAIKKPGMKQALAKIQSDEKIEKLLSFLG